MKLILVLIISIFLTSCAVTKSPNLVIPDTSVVRLDKGALTQCPLLEENLELVTFEDTILAYGSLATNYGVCANRQATSIKLLKQLGNIP